MVDTHVRRMDTMPPPTHRHPRTCSEDPSKLHYPWSVPIRIQFCGQYQYSMASIELALTRWILGTSPRMTERLGACGYEPGGCGEQLGNHGEKSSAARNTLIEYGEKACRFGKTSAHMSDAWTPRHHPHSRHPRTCSEDPSPLHYPLSVSYKSSQFGFNSSIRFSFHWRT